MAVHFVGFRGEEFNRACAIFGRPDFVHRFLDTRAIQEFAPEDIVILANGARFRPGPSFNDSEHW